MVRPGTSGPTPPPLGGTPNERSNMNDIDTRPGLWLLTSQRRPHIVIDTRTGQPVSKGDEITSFRGEKSTLQSVSRGPQYNGTSKVTNAKGWEYYDSVYELLVLPLIEAGELYRLDIYNREDMIRKYHFVQITDIAEDRTVTAYEVDDDGGPTSNEITFRWDDVYIADLYADVC